MNKNNLVCQNVPSTSVYIEKQIFERMHVCLFVQLPVRPAAVGRLRSFGLYNVHAGTLILGQYAQNA